VILVRATNCIFNTKRRPLIHICIFRSISDSDYMGARKFQKQSEGSPHLPPRNLNTILRVFHVNDSTDDQVLFQAACKKANVPIEWQVVDTSEQAISHLKSFVVLSKTESVPWPDLIILDIHMPGEKGLKVLEYIRATREIAAMPVIILTGLVSNETVMEAYGLGANAFHEKPNSFPDMVELVSGIYKVWSAARRPVLQV